MGREIQISVKALLWMVEGVKEHKCGFSSQHLHQKFKASSNNTAHSYITEIPYPLTGASLAILDRHYIQLGIPNPIPATLPALRAGKFSVFFIITTFKASLAEVVNNLV